MKKCQHKIVICEKCEEIRNREAMDARPYLHRMKEHGVRLLEGDSSRKKEAKQIVNDLIEATEDSLFQLRAAEIIGPKDLLFLEEIRHNLDISWFEVTRHQIFWLRDIYSKAIG